LNAPAETLQPYVLCQYLFKLATAFASFYETCQVLRADRPVRTSRLALCTLTARVLAKGLDILGIAAPMRMWNVPHARDTPASQAIGHGYRRSLPRN
jgi:arginyl-tRNA synthetase